MELIPNQGHRDFDARELQGPGATIDVRGDWAGAKVVILAVVDGTEFPVADGGPFGEETKDAFKEPVRRVWIPGRADAIRIALVGATAATRLEGAIR